jgi:hypothetical protein
MKLYICYGTFPAPWRPGGHPCRNAYKALQSAGHEPELVVSYGLAPLPKALNHTRGRREVEEIDGSHEIATWAEANPAVTR